MEISLKEYSKKVTEVLARLAYNDKSIDSVAVNLVNELRKIEVIPFSKEQNYAYTIDDKTMTIYLKPVDKGYKIEYKE